MTHARIYNIPGPSLERRKCCVIMDAGVQVMPAMPWTVWSEGTAVGDFPGVHPAAAPSPPNCQMLPPVMHAGYLAFNSGINPPKGSL